MWIFSFLSSKQQVTQDPSVLQAQYNATKKPVIKLTKEQKQEISWQFLYDITELIMSKFSQDDKNSLKEIGKKLSSLGAQYHHVIELPPNYQHNTNKEQNKTPLQHQQSSN
jgi:hypothetical protein